MELKEKRAHDLETDKTLKEMLKRFILQADIETIFRDHGKAKKLWFDVQSAN